MKKQLLTLAFALFMCTSADYAFELEKAPFVFQNAQAKKPQVKVPTANGFDLDFCGDLYSWYSITTDNNCTYKFYVYITPEIATALSGNQLTELVVSFASNNSKASRAGSIFISEDLDADPITSTAVTIKDNYNDKTWWTNFAFETPYTIKEGQGFYMGYEVTKCTTDDYPVPITNRETNQFCGQVDVYSSTGEFMGYLTGEDFGCNLFLQAVTVGEKKTIEDIFSVSGFSLGDFTLPVIEDINNANAYVFINNFGTNPITSIEYTATCGTNVIKDNLDANVPASTSNCLISLPLPLLTEGKNSVDISITAINGKEVDVEGSLYFIGLTNGGYERKFVVEEGTGSWCGWCPRGIVAFEQFEANYPETFIGIAIHSGDTMETPEYEELINKFFEGFPSCIINRDPIFYTDPSFDVLEYCYDLWSTQKGAAKIDAEVSYVDDSNTSVNVSTSTEFGFSDPNACYKLAYVVLENGIAGAQKNYYSGGNYGEMGGWESASSTRKWEYSHVARDIFTCWGIDGSVPTSVTAGNANHYEYQIPLSNVNDVNKSSIVVLLLDGDTGTILNATKVEAANYTESSGINSIINNETPVEYFNLQGVRMQGNNMPAGIYIMRQGGKTTKTIIR